VSQPDANVMSSPCVAAHTQIAIAINMGPRFNDRHLPRGLDQSTSTPAHVAYAAYVNPSVPTVHIRLLCSAAGKAVAVFVLPS
jgi:hypothetical protein